MPPGLSTVRVAPLPLPAPHTSPATSSLRPEHSSSLTAFSLESHLSSPDARRPREPLRQGAPGEPLSGAHRPALSGHVSPRQEERASRHAPGERKAEAVPLPLNSEAHRASRILRHSLPPSGVPLDFLTCREHCPPAHSALTARPPGTGGSAAPQSPPSRTLPPLTSGLRPR